jgi:hypothetical protein
MGRLCSCAPNPNGPDCVTPDTDDCPARGNEFNGKIKRKNDE